MFISGDRAAGLALNAWPWELTLSFELRVPRATHQLPRSRRLDLIIPPQMAGHRALRQAFAFDTDHVRGIGVAPCPAVLGFFRRARSASFRAMHSPFSHRPVILVGAFSLALLTLTAAIAADWPQFRGPTGQGLSDDKNLPVKWGGKEKENVLWQSPLNGQGHASPIVSGDAVFVCTVAWPTNGGPREKSMPAHHVTRYRTTDGKQMWDTLVPPGPWLRNDFRSGPGGGYAAPTPATDGQRVYALFASSVLAALDFEGKDRVAQGNHPAHLRCDHRHQPRAVPRHGADFVFYVQGERLVPDRFRQSHGRRKVAREISRHGLRAQHAAAD